MMAVVLTAAYYLWAAQRSFFGPLNPKWKDAKDAHGYEVAPLAVLSVLFVLFGVLPMIFFGPILEWTRAVLGG
jgi:NADH-quinone oxidoreductase subunit M